MKIRRNIASIPSRSAHETWRAIVDLVTGPITVDRGQLEAAKSIMESLIADEQPASVPIVFKGAGRRVVIYCLYDEDALETGLDVDPLDESPTSGDWRMTAPCESEDAAWMNASLRQRAPRITVHAANEAPIEEDEAEMDGDAFEINWGASKQ